MHQRGLLASYIWYGMVRPGFIDPIDWPAIGPQLGHDWPTIQPPRPWPQPPLLAFFAHTRASLTQRELEMITDTGLLISGRSQPFGNGADRLYAVD